MRSLWKGSLAFGLVNIPVKVYSATEDHDVKFHQVHREDGGRIRYRKVCEIDGQQVEFADIAKAYDTEDGQTIILTDEDFEQLPAASGHEVEVLGFVPSEQIDPMLFDRSYYLEPDTKSVKAYVLLREALESSSRIALVNFALRQKTKLAVLRVRGNVLLVQTLLWPDEIRQPEFPVLDKEVTIRADEHRMASALVDSYATDFDPAEYTDDYSVQLRQLIEAKVEGGEAFDSPSGQSESGEGEVIDLLSALRQSVRRGSRGRGSTAEEAATASAEEPAAPVKKPRARAKTG